MDATANDMRALSAAADGVVAEQCPVAMIPRNTRPLIPLSPDRRALFAANLRAALQEAALLPVVASPADNDSATSERRVALRAATCTACRGECCRAGGDHAFLRADQVARLRGRPDWPGDDVAVDSYLSRLPAEVIAGGCVFQSASGCTLTRDTRASICNRYLCRGLRDADARVVDDTPALYVVYRNGHALSAGHFVAPTGHVV